MREGLREIRELHKELDVKFDALLDSQMRTTRDRKTDEKIQSLARIPAPKNGNGHR